ncbi:MAG: preprotein translocase subunit SecG [Muribaculaceae bacterium]|nr:preprotein translocase subunit SecG [Muribaculaceae bacterium]MDE6093607.1 preprotein translocase subunit SecG [Muribaculaceae bacterium]
MNAVIIILTVLVSILLIAVVLVQKSKGGGLASNFSGSNQIMGVRRTNDFIEKATWTLGCAIAILSIVAVWIAPNGQQSGARVKNATPVETSAPEFPTPAATELPASSTDTETPVETPAPEAAE